MSMTDNQDVDKQVDREYAEAWRYEPGDKLIGETVELSQREGAYGIYPIITVRQDNGVELAFHAFHTVARNELAKAAPQVGERIAIKYVGVKEAGGEGRSSYHAYKVAVDRAARAFNWSAFGETGEVEPDIPADDGPPLSTVPTDDDIPF
jgi:hypothetical protein